MIFLWHLSSFHFWPYLFLIVFNAYPLLCPLTVLQGSQTNWLSQWIVNHSRILCSSINFVHLISKTEDLPRTLHQSLIYFSMAPHIHKTIKWSSGTKQRSVWCYERLQRDKSWHCGVRGVHIFLLVLWDCTVVIEQRLWTQRPGFRIQFCHFPTLWTWAGHLASLCFNHLSHKWNCWEG